MKRYFSWWLAIPNFWIHPKISKLLCVTGKAPKGHHNTELFMGKNLQIYVMLPPPTKVVLTTFTKFAFASPSHSATGGDNSPSVSYATYKTAISCIILFSKKKQNQLGPISEKKVKMYIPD